MLLVMSMMRNTTITIEQIDGRIDELKMQIPHAIRRTPDKNKNAVKRQILGRIYELQRLKAYLTGGKRTW